MDKARFIESYVAAFLGAVAATKYLGVFDSSRWPSTQPVNDAVTLAEYAWASLEKQAKPSTAATTGNAVTATTVTDSTLTT